MKKYLYVFGLSLQNVLQRRASLVMDRVGGLATILALYYFWVALLRGKDEFMGYSRSQMLSYVLLMNVLRAFVFTGRGWELVGEIAHGRISSYLLRPISYQGYSLSLDLGQKTIHVVSSLVEICALAFIFGAPVYLPARAGTWFLFVAAVIASSLLFFFLEFLVSCLAFWTSESGGPLFCFELFLNFAAGSFFPIDVLPGWLQSALHATPFPYLVFFPINIYLERVSAAEGMRLLGIELGWLVLIWLAVQAVWRRGCGELRGGGRVRKLLRVWVRMAAMSFGAQLSYGFGSLGFLIGKMIRLLFFFAYLVAIFRHTNTLAGYSLAQTVLFFLTYNIVDITAQVFFRGIYGARRAVQDGDLDYYLIQPCPPLVRLAASTVDFLDVATLAPVLALLALTWTRLPAIGPFEIAAYALLVANGIAIALAIHIFVAGLAVRTQELENTIWIYRELMFLGRFPVDIYSGPLRFALTVLLPIGVMTSFPAKALLGLLSPGQMLYAVAVASAAMAFSLWFWRDALARYTSVSS